MTSIDQFTDDIMKLVSKDKLKEAIKEIQKLLKESPTMLKEVVLQSARYNEVTASIHRGTINYTDASVEKNKIRFALMNILQDMSRGIEEKENVKTEVERYLSDREAGKVNQVKIEGDGNINAQDISGSNISINVGSSSAQKNDRHSSDKSD